MHKYVHGEIQVGKNNTINEQTSAALIIPISKACDRKNVIYKFYAYRVSRADLLSKSQETPCPLQPSCPDLEFPCWAHQTHQDLPTPSVNLKIRIMWILSRFYVFCIIYHDSRLNKIDKSNSA